ncbi:hypothetical protein EMMF5_002435 [Cystobasidiomycetes sp. EMM_F5]
MKIVPFVAATGLVAGVLADPLQETKRAAVSVVATIENYDSMGKWQLDSSHSVGGMWNIKPPETLCVPSGGGDSCINTFSIESDGIMTGAEARVIYKNAYTQAGVEFHVSAPFIGDNSYKVTPSGRDVSFSGGIEQGTNVKAKFTIARTYIPFGSRSKRAVRA